MPVAEANASAAAALAELAEARAAEADARTEDSDAEEAAAASSVVLDIVGETLRPHRRCMTSNQQNSSATDTDV